MGQFGFFDADKRLAVISAKGDPLELIDRVVPFESFRAEIEAATLTPASEKKSNAGRKPIDVIVMFRMLVLQSLYNLSDEQIEYQVRDRLSFTRFVRLGIEDSFPTARRFGCSGRRLRRPVSLRNCSSVLASIWKRGATSLAAARWLMRRLFRFPSSVIAVTKMRM